MDSYESILSKAWNEVPEVADALPTGSWRLKARSAKFMEPREEGNSARVIFVYVPQEPMDDVDEEALDALGKDGEEYDFTENRIFAQFWVETVADWGKVRSHLEKLGAYDEDASIEDSLKAVGGQEVIGYLDQRTYTDNAGELKVTNDVGNFVAVDD